MFKKILMVVLFCSLSFVKAGACRTFLGNCARVMRANSFRQQAAKFRTYCPKRSQLTRRQALELFGFSTEAQPTPAEIKKIYFTLAQRHHPDRPGGDTELIKKINAAKDALLAEDFAPEEACANVTAEQIRWQQQQGGEWKELATKYELQEVKWKNRVLAWHSDWAKNNAIVAAMAAIRVQKIAQMIQLFEWQQQDMLVKIKGIKESLKIEEEKLPEAKKRSEEAKIVSKEAYKKWLEASAAASVQGGEAKKVAEEVYKRWLELSAIATTQNIKLEATLRNIRAEKELLDDNEHYHKLLQIRLNSMKDELRYAQETADRLDRKAEVGVPYEKLRSVYESIKNACKF